MAFALPLLFAFLIILFPRELSRRIKLARATLLLPILGIILLAISCGGGSSSAPPPPQPASYNITVSGSSGSLNNSTNLTLIVNP